MQLYSMATPNIATAIILLEELLSLGIYHGRLTVNWRVREPPLCFTPLNIRTLPPSRHIQGILKEQ